MKIGFTASRNGITCEQQTALTHQLHRMGAREFHHGDCRGGDEQAHHIARTLGIAVVGHPPTARGLRAYCHCDQLRPPAPFLSRNHNIVLETAALIACPDAPEYRRSGTWATVRYARRLQLPYLIVMPDGSLTSEGDGWFDSALGLH